MSLLSKHGLGRHEFKDGSCSEEVKMELLKKLGYTDKPGLWWNSWKALSPSSRSNHPKKSEIFNICPFSVTIKDQGDFYLSSGDTVGKFVIEYASINSEDYILEKEYHPNEILEAVADAIAEAEKLRERVMSYKEYVSDFDYRKKIEELKEKELLDSAEIVRFRLCTDWKGYLIRVNVGV